MRNVLVSGGSRGLGLAIASRLALTGYRVIALARTDSPALRAVRTQSFIFGPVILRIWRESVPWSVDCAKNSGLSMGSSIMPVSERADC